MRKMLLSAVATAAMAVPLALDGAASASTAAAPGLGPAYVTSYAHQVHVWHVAHVAHMEHVNGLSWG